MHKEPSIFGTLVRYFFARFFANDVIQSEGDTVTTVVRALSITAVPGLMIAFFLQNQYPARNAWGRIEDHYFFVLYSMLVMAGVAVFEWEMLFPDRLDFLVLSPLSLRGWQMLGAKAVALAGFLGLFLLSADVFGIFVMPMVSKSGFWLAVYAQGLAVLMAGVFAAFSIIAAGGLLLCVLPARLFRLVSPLVQMFVVALLGLLLAHYLRFGDVLDKTLSLSGRATRWVPSFWFLGVYECVLHGRSAAEFAGPMAKRGIWATGAALVSAVIVYPLAWIRMRRMAVEGAAALKGKPTPRRDAWMERLVSPPARRAVTHFIGQTISRNSQYQVYLAMYCGVGLALAIACAVTFAGRGASLHPMLSPYGLHAVAPLLLFWIIAGLRMAFQLPLNLPARWIFRVSGADRDTCRSAARVWASACAFAVLCAVMIVLSAAGFGERSLLVQAVCGVCILTTMLDVLLFADEGIPFAQPRSPGKTSLPLMLTLFVGIFPTYLFCMTWIELAIEQKLARLFYPVAFAVAVHWSSESLALRSHAKLEDGDEVEGEFQLLGLSAD